MTYGLRVTASGGQFQIDSSLNGTKHLAVHAVSNAIAGASISIGPQDILFVRGPPGSGSNAGRVQTNFSVTMSGSTMTGVVATFRFPTDYIVCKPSDSSSSSLSPPVSIFWCVFDALERFTPPLEVI